MSFLFQFSSFYHLLLVFFYCPETIVIFLLSQLRSRDPDGSVPPLLRQYLRAAVSRGGERKSREGTQALRSKGGRFAYLSQYLRRLDSGIVRSSSIHADVLYMFVLVGFLRQGFPRVGRSGAHQHTCMLLIMMMTMNMYDDDRNEDGVHFDVYDDAIFLIVMMTVMMIVMMIVMMTVMMVQASKNRTWASRNYLSQRALLHADSVRSQLAVILTSLGIDGALTLVEYTHMYTRLLVKQNGNKGLKIVKQKLKS